MASLTQRRCAPCEGGVEPLTSNQAAELMTQTPGWSLSEDGMSIYRKVSCKHFLDAVQTINTIAELAEDEQHHPDLHLTGYRKLKVVLTTHAINGLSENDFIVAAKVDQLLESSASSDN